MRTFVVALAALLVTPGLSAAQLACGDVVETAVVSLGGDLDCTGQPGAALTLTRATLKLNGFTVRGAEGIQCAEACKVLGPGTVENSTKSGIWSNLWFATRYTIVKVTIRNNALWGMAGFVGATDGQSELVLRDSIVEGNGLSGIFADAKATVLRSTVRGNGTANGGAGIAVLHGRAVVSRSTVENNADEGIYVRDDARVIGTTVTGNGSGGVVAGTFGCSTASAVKAFRATITGNASGACAAGDCADIVACTAPRLTATICDHSHQLASGLPGDDWNVCALD